MSEHRPIALPLLALLAVCGRTSAQDVLESSSQIWADFDGDGLEDLYSMAPGREDTLWRSVGDGSFEDGTTALGLGGSTSRGGILVDLDQDAVAELLLIGDQGVRLLQSAPDGSFHDRTARSGLEGCVALRSGSLRDLDGDGRPDLALEASGAQPVVLFRALGGLVFERLRLGVPASGGSLLVPLSEPEDSDGREEPHRAPEERGGPDPGAPGPATPGAEEIQLGPRYADALRDAQYSGERLFASRSPQLGQLFPLSQDLFVDPSGQVGLGTTSPVRRLDVEGVVRSKSGGFEFPDGSVQATAQTVGPAGPTGPAGPVGPVGPAGDSHWQLNGDATYRLDGTLGIGTSVPTSELDVRVPEDATLSLWNTADTTRLLLTAGPDDCAIGNLSFSDLRFQTGATDQLVIRREGGPDDGRTEVLGGTLNTATGGGSLHVGDTTLNGHLSLDPNEVQAYGPGGASVRSLYLNYWGGNVQLGSSSRAGSNSLYGPTYLYDEVVRPAMDVAFHATASITQPVGFAQKVLLDTEELDDGFHFNSFTSTFVVPADGVYQFSASLGFSSVSSDAYSAGMNLYKNGVRYKQLGRADYFELAVSGSVCVPLSEGDSITLWVENYQLGGLTLSSSPESTWFSGHRVH